MERKGSTYHDKKLPFPEYPKEESHDDPVRYEAAINQFGMDCKHVADIAHTSEATCLQVEEGKWH